MEDFFNNQSYNQYSPQFIGEPVEDIKAINKEKQLAYDYVLDKTLTLTDVLNNVKHLKASEDVYLDAKKSVEELQKTYAEDGDYENKILDINKFAQNLAYDKGLKAVQEQYASKENFIAKAVQDEKDNHDISRATAIGMRRTKAVERDEVTGLWNNINFDAPTIPESINWAKELIDVFKGFQSGSIALTQELKDRYGEELQGYFNIVTAEGVTDAEIAQAANAYLLGNNKFKERLQFENLVERENLVQEDGTYRARTIEDLSKFIPKDAAALEQFLDSFSTEDRPINSIEDFNRLAEERGIEETYNHLFNSGYMNTLIEPVVRKEGFIKYNQNVHQDWVLKEALKEANAGPTGNNPEEPYVPEAVAGVALVTSTEVTTSNDLSSVYKQAGVIDAALKQAEKNLAEVKASPNPDKAQLKKFEDDIASAKLAKHRLKEHSDRIATFIEDKTGISLESEYEGYVQARELDKRAWSREQANKANRAGMGKFATRQNQDASAYYAQYDIENPLGTFEEFSQQVFGSFEDASNTYSIVRKAKSIFKGGDLAFQAKSTASKIKEQNLDFTEYDSTRDGYVYVPQSGSKTEPYYKAETNRLTEQFFRAPETFVDNLTNKNFYQMAEEDFGVEEELLDIEATSKNVVPLLGETLNGEQAYLITVMGWDDKDKRGPSKRMGTMMINSADKNSGFNMQKIASEESSTLFKKKAAQGGHLDASDTTTLRKWGAIWMANTPASANLEMLGVDSFTDGSEGEWDLGNGSSLMVYGAKNYSADDNGDAKMGDVYLRLKHANGQIYSFDDKGVNAFRDPDVVNDPDSSVLPHNFNDKYELKEVIGVQLLEANNKGMQVQSSGGGGGAYSALLNARAGANTTPAPVVDYTQFSYDKERDKAHMDNLKPDLKLGINEFAALAQNSGITLKEIQVNSTMEGEHSTNSPHFIGEAIDIQATDKLKALFKVTKAHEKINSIHVLGWLGNTRVLYEGPKSNNPNGRGHFHLDLQAK